jgi:hypothetical protein
VSGLFLYNAVVFGTPFHVAYSSYLDGETMLREHRLGIFGVHWPGWSQFVRVLAEITIRSQRGLLYLGLDGLRIFACSPVLWIALPGLGWLFFKTRYRLEALLIAFAAGAYLTFNACYGDSIIFWGGGTTFGPRHIIPMLPLLALPIAFGARMMPWLFFPLLAVSAFYMLIALAIEPRAPYVFQNPARDLYLPRYLDAWFGFGRSSLFVPEPFPEQPLAAYNLAELAGLPRRWHLVPLLAVWFVLGRQLVLLLWPRRTEPNVRRKQPAPPRPWISREWALTGLAAFTLAVGLTPVVLGYVKDRNYQEPANGLRGRYYTNRAWLGDPAKTRVDTRIDFNWWGHPPLMPPFSVLWNGMLRIPVSGTYRFRIESADATTVEIAGRVVINSSGAGGVESFSGETTLDAGEYPVLIRYMNLAGDSIIRFFWKPPGGADEIVPQALLRPDA